MTRTLFFLTALSAMLFALTAVLIRIELFAPGVSPLFQAADAIPDSAKFNRVTQFHALMGYLTTLLLGTTLAAAGREKGGLFAVPVMGLGMMLSALAFVATVLITWPVPDGGGGLAGWSLYPSDAQRPTSLFEAVTLMVNIDPFFTDVPMVALIQTLTLPASGLLTLSFYVLLSTQPKLRWVAVPGVVLTLVMVFVSTTWVLYADPVNTNALLLLPLFPFLAAACVRMTDDPPAWLVTLTLGVLCVIVLGVGLFAWADTLPVEGTQVGVAALYLYPLGLGWFALPALIQVRWGTRLPAPLIWTLPAAILTLLLLWTAPLFRTGLNGQPRGYIDYPDGLAADNMGATLATGVFVVGYLAIITLVRRSRT